MVEDKLTRLKTIANMWPSEVDGRPSRHNFALWEFDKINKELKNLEKLDEVRRREKASEPLAANKIKNSTYCTIS